MAEPLQPRIRATYVAVCIGTHRYWTEITTPLQKEHCRAFMPLGLKCVPCFLPYVAARYRRLGLPVAKFDAGAGSPS